MRRAEFHKHLKERDVRDAGERRRLRLAAVRRVRAKKGVAACESTHPMKECPTCRRCFADHINHCPTDGGVLTFSITGDPVLDGRYQLEHRIAKGGMGVVYKARHIFLKTAHAIKIILPDLVGNDPSLATRFRQEAMAAAAIHHQNIIAVTDYGVINGSMPFIVMEYIQGISLQDLISQEGPLAPERALEILQAVAAGVGAAHRQGIVHRDLKPLNIMLKSDVPTIEGVKVLDFGLAKIKSGELLGSFVAAQTTGMMGSPLYMAPEQWEDEEPARSADVYSMGVILYQMLAGDVPFKGASVPSIMKMHLTAPPPPFIDRGIPLAPAIESAVRHALEKEPANRPPTVEAFVAELRAAVLSSQTASLSGGVSGMETVRLESSAFDTAMLPLSTNDHLPVDTGGGEASTPGAPYEPGVLPTVTDGRDAFAPPSNNAIADTARRQAEETARQQRAIEDAARRRAEAESARRVAEENARLEAEAAYRRRSDEERAQREAEQAQQQRRQAEQERVGREAEQRAEAEAAAGRARRLESERAVEQARAVVLPPPDASTPARSRLPLFMLAGIAALVLLGGMAGLAYVVKTRIIDKRAGNGGGGVIVNGDPTPNPTPSASPVVTPEKPELVELPGGTFRLGRSDAPPRSSDASQRNQVWLYNQWPVQRVEIEPLAIYKNEVTNAEYAAFVSEAAYPPPPDWDGNQPRPGQEQWPVRNITFEDANRFAVWRSARDKVSYRLPTEAEWEYAARGGDAARLFPWGAEWIEGRANLDAENLKPVGSFPEGATPQGALDMIGNVWEWTSSEASMYKGNNVLALANDDRDKIVVRGGSFQSSARGDELITATARRWVSRDKRDPTLGFRLVRE